MTEFMKWIQGLPLKLAIVIGAAAVVRLRPIVSWDLEANSQYGIPVVLALVGMFLAWFVPNRQAVKNWKKIVWCSSALALSIVAYLVYQWLIVQTPPSDNELLYAAQYYVAMILYIVFPIFLGYGMAHVAEGVARIIGKEIGKGKESPKARVANSPEKKSE